MLTNTMDLASKVEELKYKIIHSLTSTDIQYIIQDLKEEHYLVDNLDTKIKDIENFLSKLLSNDTDLQNQQTDLQNQIKSLIDCCTKTQSTLNDLQNQINNLNTTSSTEPTEPIDTSDPCIRLGLIYNVITNEETLETLSKKFNIDDIKNTFYKNDKYGIGWGTNENKWRYLEVPVPKDAVKIKLTYTGFYNSPSGGMGYLEITKKKNGSSDDRLFSFRDAWTNDYEGQTLVINQNNILIKKTTNIINRTDEIIIPQDDCIPKLYIGMTGYTSSYPYSKRYIKEFTFLKTTESSGSEIINIEKPSIIKTINDMNFLLCSDTFSAQNCIINFTLSNLIPGKSYRLYFDIGSFSSIDTNSGATCQHDKIEISINDTDNDIETYSFDENPDLSCEERKIINTKGEKFDFTMIGKALPGQEVTAYNSCSKINHIYFDFTAINETETGSIKLITDERYSNEAWALLENGCKIEEIEEIEEINETLLVRVKENSGKIINEIDNKEFNYSGIVIKSQYEFAPNLDTNSSNDSHSNDYIEIPKDYFSDNFKIEFLLHINSSTGLIEDNIYGSIFSNYNCSYQNFLIMNINVQSNGKFSFRSQFGLRDSSKNESSFTTINDLEANIWYKVVYIIDRNNNKSELYIGEWHSTNDIQWQNVNYDFNDNNIISQTNLTQDPLIFGWVDNCSNSNTISPDIKINDFKVYKF